MKPWEVALLEGRELTHMLAVLNAREARARQQAGAGLAVFEDDE